MNYRFPLKAWMVDIFKERQANINKSNYKMPFVIMSSAAKIVQAKPQATKKEILEQVADILKHPETASPKYKGCIITNHIDPKINYNIGKTIVGFDFDGKAIECENEAGRKISPVIIETLDIKVDGTAMFRKTATVTMKCFSLQQLELVEQFFLQMGMHILIEFGDNSNINELINQKILATKSNHKDFVDAYLNYQIPTTKEFKDYLDDCKKSKGTYDRYAGVLYDYNYKINNDGTFSVIATYIQGNEINYQMPLTLSTGFGTIKVPQDPKPTLFKEIMYNIANDMPGMDLQALNLLNENEWKDEFFNFDKTKNTIADAVTSSTPYVSLKFILEVILNNIVAKGGQNPDFTMVVPNSGNNKIFKIGKDKYDKIIPIKIHKYITAQDGTVLFPNKSFPKYGVDKNGTLTKDTKNLQDVSINKKSIVVNDTVEFIHPSGNETINLPEPFTIGNALNIFIDYNEIISIFRKSYNRIDFLVQVLETINDRSFGFFKLGYGNLIENSLATVIDFKLYSELKKDATEKNPARKDFRFNPLSVDSIIRDFDYTFNMDSQMASIAILNANAFVAQNRYANEKVKSDSIEYQDRIYGLSSYANHATIDGLYSINEIQYKKLTPPTNTQLYTKIDDSLLQSASLAGSENESLIKYKLNPKDTGTGSVQTLAVANPNYLYTFLTGNTEKYDTNTQVTSNISISFKVDGISGLNIGETFKIDGIPEIRNKIGEFRIQNIEHSVNSNDGWITTIHADWAYTYII
jgi:hypothetical protein